MLEFIASFFVFFFVQIIRKKEANKEQKKIVADTSICFANLFRDVQCDMNERPPSSLISYHLENGLSKASNRNLTLNTVNRNNTVITMFVHHWPVQIISHWFLLGFILSF
jgi:hypothetical protein